MLLSNIGSKAYGVLRSLAVPTAPKELKYAEVVKTLKGHYELAPLVTAERYQFHQHNQDVGETIAEYVVELQCLATKCKFEETKNFLEDSLRDCFVFRLHIESTRKSKPKLTFTKAIKIAQSIETASRDAQQSSEQASSKFTPCQ